MCALSLPEIPTDYSGPLARTYSVTRLNKEHAGQSFREKYEGTTMTPSGSVNPTAASTEDVSVNGPTESTENSPKNKTSNSRHTKSIGSTTASVRAAAEGNDDLYELCCVKKGASADEIKVVYRKLCMVFHPDKTVKSQNTGNASLSNAFELPIPNIGNMTGEQVSEHFVKIKNAFEILSNKESRRKYDSTLPFDDYLPSVLTQEDFWDIAPAMFEKESIWAAKLPVAQIGDMSTPIEAVKKFYKYWLGFESWRDFSNAAPYDLEHAHDREEKRWMQKENYKRVVKLVNDEKTRVLRFVQLAEAADPRIAKHTAEVKASREAAKLKNLNPAQTAKAKTQQAEQAKVQEMKEKRAAALKAVQESQRIASDVKKAKESIKTILKKWVKDIPNPPAYLAVEERLPEFFNQAAPTLIIKTGINIESEVKRQREENATTALRLLAMLSEAMSSIQTPAS